MPALYEVAFSSADDADIDAELTLLEDKPMTLEDITAVCEKYKIRAKVIEDGRLVREIVPDGMPKRSWG